MPNEPKPLVLDFLTESEKLRHNKRRRLVLGKPISKVSLTFADGTVQEYELPTEQQALYRERITYEEHANSDRIQWELHVHEVFWAERLPYENRG